LSLICRILPLDIGFVKSSTIRTHRYSPHPTLSSSTSTSSSAYVQPRGRLNICIQNAAFSNSKYAKGVSPLNSTRDTRSPSKVHGRLSIICVLSHSFSNSIKKILTPTDLKVTCLVGCQALIRGVLIRGGNSGRCVGFGSDTITTRHDYF
jgi:hypothetical protein